MSEPDPQEYPTDFDLIICDEVDSTSDALRRLLVEKSESEGAYPARLIPAVMALRQTKGRGRLGRFWASPPGGLYLSVALDTTEASCGEPALSLIVALALRTMLAEYLQQEQTRAQGARSNPQDIQVKWPNDITCSEGKIAGILVESVPLASKRRVAIVGVGINVTQPTDTASPSAASRNSIAQTAGNSTTSPVSAVSPDQAASHNTVAQ
ncbi:MAG: biotin--[acetyl-CoA-carboxylase] ligase, partial [Coriobacteriales bacterium]|nr:biotin--[acetyl-CoA-carboxylase] ligase [Coriobacteriales bacterium]